MKILNDSFVKRKRLTRITQFPVAIASIASLLASLPIFALPQKQVPNNKPQVSINFAPILPLKIVKPNTIPLIEEAMRDPKTKKHKPKNNDKLSDLYQDRKKLKFALKTSKTNKKSTIAMQLVENYAAEAYYYGDRLSGRYGGGDENKNRNKMLNAYKKVIEYANVVQSLTKNKQMHDRASYHMFVAEFLRNNNKSSQLKKLSQLIRKKTLSKSLTNRIVFLTSIERLEAANDTNALANLETIKNALSTSGNIASKLAIARTLAGLDGKGNKVRPAKKEYRNNLFAASDKSFRIGKKDKKKVFEFIIGVWRISEGEKATWKKPPYIEERFKTYSEIDSIHERAALWDWNFGNKKSAISGYQVLAFSLKQHQIAIKLDNRVLDMEEQIFINSGNPQDYEKLLIATRQKYADEKSLGREIGANEKNMAASLLLRHKKLVEFTIIKAKSPSAPPPLRVSSINIANRYIRLSENKKSKAIEVLEAEIANLWVLNREYSKAVDIYLRISKTASNPDKLKYLYNALNSQLIVANWPKTVEWAKANQPSKSLQSREKLLEIYLEINTVKQPKIDWEINAQIGNLYLNLNQDKKAFEVWDKAIKKSPKHKYASIASGIMLSTYLKNNLWGELEDLARFTLFAKVIPVFGKQTLQPATLLPLALIKGADQAYQKKDFKTAIKKYKEFSYKFNTKDNDYGMMMLAYAYHEDGQHTQSITTLASFTEKFPRTRYYKKVLKTGGDWSVALTFEENTMFFYKEFLRYFSNDPDSVQIAEKLSNLYFGRRLYSEAIDILEKLSTSQHLNNIAKADILLKIMRLEDSQGNKAKALQTANRIVQTNGSAITKSEAYIIIAEHLYHIRNILALNDIIRKIKALGSGSAIDENLAHTHYLLAEAKIGPMLKSVNSHTVENPLQAVFDRYNLYIKSYKDFSTVCELGNTSWCAPALHRSARLAERMVTLIEDFQIPATLDDKVIDDFIKQKNGLIDNLTKIIITSDTKARSLLNNQYLDPDWTQEILWQNSNDWNFERVSGELGLGFLQWEYDN
ncbi:MAG: tetratricopeptide repeat protein [Bdellovibrionota bacterium]